MLRLVAGVQIARYTQQSGATSAGRVGDFNVHGVHSLQNNFLLDGIDNNTISENVQELSTESAHPSVDTIQEFNVVTNPYSAEYGRSPGAAVSISTKGGSNAFHGLAYEYLRNAAFDANDFISNEHKLTKPENNQNQFGGNFGGPILKNRLFGFFNYEGTRIKQGVSRVSTVPLPNERIGDFSPETAASLGLPAYPTIYDPTTGLPFADNKIPAGRIDTAVSGLMNLFPLPNASGDLNNFARNALAQDNDDSYDGRIDYTMNSSNTFFGRYSYSNRFRFIPGYLGGIADGTSTSAWGRQSLKSYSFVLGYTHIFTPTLVNDFHFGWIRNYSYCGTGSIWAECRRPIRTWNSEQSGDRGRRAPNDVLELRVRRVAGLFAEEADSTAVSVFGHDFVDARGAFVQVRRHTVGADAQYLPGRTGDARRFRIHGRVHELCGCRGRGLPVEEWTVVCGRIARADAEHTVDERFLCRSETVDAGGLR